MYILYDLNDHNEYGSFYQRSDATAPMQCTVNGKFCRSEAEWRFLIAPYMGDTQ
jgi:hypothetical protein